MDAISLLKINPVTEILGSIRDSLANAQRSFDDGMLTDDSYEAYVESHLNVAFIKMRLFLEAANLPEMLNCVKELHALANEEYCKAEVSPESGEPYLVWGYKLRQYIYSIECVFGEPLGGTVTKDVVEVLKAAQYSITDRKCFDRPPNNERDVHVRIEAVLRCIFPDLIHKPKITKPIKHFEPDTGLPGIRTLIEYKFIATLTEAKRVCEELLADTRGYVSKEWDNFIYVIYETKRIQSEKQWNQLLKTSGIDRTTSIIVIHGEEPKKRSAKAMGADF